MTKADGSKKAASNLKVVAFPPEGADAPRRDLALYGREAWCLNELVRAGAQGITSLAYPGARLSHYVFCLRRHGLAIDTTSEANTGAFNGTHGRYTLKSRVRIVSAVGFREMGGAHAALA
jgi:hypothetical protein